jgi:hypothetical protein
MHLSNAARHSLRAMVGAQCQAEPRGVSSESLHRYSQYDMVRHPILPSCIDSYAHLRALLSTPATTNPVTAAAPASNPIPNISFAFRIARGSLPMYPSLCTEFSISVRRDRACILSGSTESSRSFISFVPFIVVKDKK